ncbi:hypothetical protein [Mycolicibacter algericus]|uniref:hypothetical protein n=1 Tax=Mycolicibacter algericus TaxID=1288388 RepID=UPI001054BB14|nr:hypothetical protein [Mycolicibacter algericus]
MLTVATLMLGVVVAVQAAMLHARGWRIALGSVPEWLAAFGTFAAFGALLIAAREWRAGQDERRSLEDERRAADAERRALAATREAERQDNEVSQARLIIVEHVPYEDRTWGGSDPPPPSQRQVVIRNRSTAPVFHLHIEDHPSGNDDVYVFQNFAHARGRPADIPVLAADDATAAITVAGNAGEAPSTEYVEFTFTDARGTNWRRIGSNQPVRLIGD